MKVKVDQDVCIGCGLCINLCSNVFEIDEQGKSKVGVKEIPVEFENDVLQCKDVCPVGAIKEV